MEIIGSKPEKWLVFGASGGVLDQILFTAVHKIIY